jgi:hypothetical protein
LFSKVDRSKILHQEERRSSNTECTISERMWYINAANHTLTSYNSGYKSYQAAKAGQAIRAEKSLVTIDQKVYGAAKPLASLMVQEKKPEGNIKRKPRKTRIHVLSREKTRNPNKRPTRVKPQN